MKILELNLERGWRGGERQTLWSAMRFRDTGHEVALLAREGEPLAAAAAKAGLTVHGLQGSAQALPFLATQGQRFDILHSQTAHMLSWCVMTKWLHRRPIVCSRRVAFALGGGFSRLKYRLADKVVAISEACAAAPREAGVADVRIIRSAVRADPPDTEAVIRFVHEHGLQGKKVLATMAALATDKDPHTMVRAIDLLRRRRQDFVFLHFGYGALTEEVAEAVRRAGLEDHYRLMGFHRNPEDLYACMDGYVMSSREEGLGSSVLDAMMHRVPVASTDAGGLAEVLGEGRGLLSAVGNAQALADNMERLLSEDPAAAQARRDMIDRAHAWVRRECDVDSMGDRYLALFEELLEQRR